MLTRGVEFQFKSGEIVLSFEPDSSKAKVLYEAKVLDCSVSHDRKARRKPSYLIHFQGWNNSWDRVVPESFLLKNNEENRRLMAKLATISTRVKRNSMRIQKIDQALRKHFRRKSRAGGEPSTLEEEEEENEEGGSDDEGSTENESGVKGESSSDRGEAGGASGGDESEESSDDMEESESGINENRNETDSDEPMEDESESLDPVHLDLFDGLKQKLEADYDLINRQKKLVRLPCVPNVISVLESYVKTFAVSVLCETVEKQKAHRLRSHQHQGPEKSMDLCKEVVDGLRLIFDFTLPLMLLYERERMQYRQAIDFYATPSASLAPKLEAEGQSYDSSSDEVSFRTPRLAPPPAAPPATPTPPSQRRITRHSAAGSGGESTTPVAPPSAKRGGTNRRSDAASAPTEPIALRCAKELEALQRCNEPANHAARRLAEGGAKGGGGASPRQRLGSVSSEMASSVATSSVLRLAAGGDEDSSSLKEIVVKEILTWRLLPELVGAREGQGGAEGGVGGGSVQPSLVYGAQHLLRLCVELPDLVTRMRVPQSARQPLVKHLQLFIDYLDSHRDELFPVASGTYIKAEEAAMFPPPVLSKHR